MAILLRHHLFQTHNNKQGRIFVPLSKLSVMSVRQEFLSLNRISELVWDSECYEAVAPSDSSSEDEECFEDEPGVSQLQQDRPTSRCHASSSSFSSNAADEEENFQIGSGQQVETPSTSQWTLPCGPHRSVVGARRGGPQVAKRQRNATYRRTCS